MRTVRLSGVSWITKSCTSKYPEMSGCFRTCARWPAGRVGGRGGGLVTGSLRPVAVPFVATAPGGARVRARLRVSPQDEAVLRSVGAHLGSLAGKDLAARCAQGRLDARGRARSRATRKRALTAASSSRWAGTITRTSEDQVRLAEQNQRAQRASLQARIRRIEARLAITAGGKAGQVRGYATAAERHAKTVRLPHPGNPPPHQAPGSHPAPRPAGLTGPRQSTRQPKTVRGRQPDRTTSC